MNWDSPAAPLVIAHRGASADAPENTMAAFRLAVEQGADAIELDAQLTADGQVAILHDVYPGGVFRGLRPVTRRTMAEVRRAEGGDNHPVPSLDQVFTAFGSRILYVVELKDFSWRGRGLEEAVNGLIRDHDVAEQALVASFNPLAIRRAQRLLPAATMTAVIRASGPLRLGHYLARGEADHPHHWLVSAGYVAWARRRGLRIHTWTVDEPRRAVALARLGADAIATNKPGLIKESLQQWRRQHARQGDP